MRKQELYRREFIRKGFHGTTAGIAVSSLSRQIIGANDRIRIGLIGCGSRGNYLLQRNLESSGSQNTEIGALCDVWKLNLDKTIESLSKSQAARPMTSPRFEDLLAMKDLDAVIIATPDFAHTPVLINAVEAGKDAYVEKPMATRLEDANIAIDLVAEKGAVVQVGTQRRSELRYHAGARLIRSGILGKISEIEAGWHDSRPRWARDFSDVKEEDVDWDQYLMYLPKRPFSAERFRRWHLFNDFTVGTPGLLGSHLIDVATWFMNDPLPASAVAHGGVYVWKDGREHADTIDCLLEYPKGFLVNYSTRLGNRAPVSGKDKPIPTTFYGTRGTFDTATWSARGIGGGEDSITEPVVVDVEEGNEAHVRNWLECLRSRKKPNAPIEAGYAHSVASIMCFEAWKSGRKQSFDSVRRIILPG